MQLAIRHIIQPFGTELFQMTFDQPLAQRVEQRVDRNGTSDLEADMRLLQAGGEAHGAADGMGGSVAARYRPRVIA